MNKSQDQLRILSPNDTNFVFERFFSDANSSPRGRECSRVKTASNPFSLSRTSISYGPKLILSPGFTETFVDI